MASECPPKLQTPRVHGTVESAKAPVKCECEQLPVLFFQEGLKLIISIKSVAFMMNNILIKIFTEI